MKERRKSIFKVWIPILCGCIFICVLHYYQVVQKTIDRTVDSIDYTSHMYSFYGRMNDQQIAMSSKEFEKEYDQIGRTYFNDSYCFKGIINKDNQIERLDMIEQPIFETQMLLSSENGQAHNLDLSKFTDIEMQQLLTFLKANYTNKIEAEVSGIQKEATHEGSYVPPKLIVEYLKLNDQIIKNGDVTNKIETYFNGYYDEDTIIIGSWDEYQGKYVDIAGMKDSIKTIVDANVEEEITDSTITPSSHKIELEKDYYLYELFTFYIEPGSEKTVNFLAVTVVPSLRQRISQEVLSDNIILYGSVLALLVIVFGYFQYCHWRPTKKIVSMIAKYHGEATSLHEVSTYIETTHTRYQQDKEQLQQKCQYLESRLEIYRVLEKVEEQPEIEVFINTILKPYQGLLDNKKITAFITFQKHPVINNREEYQEIMNGLLNYLVYQMTMNQNIEICVDEKETTIILSDLTISLENSEVLLMIFEKHHIAYHVDRNGDKQIITFYY